MTIAKGLGAGYQPIGALMCTDTVHDAIANGSGFFQHGHTYMGHTAACAGALAVQQVIQEEGLLKNVITQGANLESALNERLGNHAHVGDIRGRGLFWGIELVSDRSSKTPFAPESRLHAKVKMEAMKLGLMCYPMGGTVNGKDGDHILLAPPFIVNADDVAQIAETIGDAIDNAISQSCSQS